MVAKVRDFAAPNLSVSAASFEQILPQHRDDFLYCDPPYYLDEGKLFIGIYPQRNFPVHHAGFDHARLRDELRVHRGGFLPLPITIVPSSASGTPIAKSRCPAGNIRSGRARRASAPTGGAIMATAT